MEVNITHFDDRILVCLSGQFTFTDAQKFKSVMSTALEGQAKFINIDFAGVTFIDSAGMGMMLLLRDACQSRNIPVSISAAQGQVEKVFVISKFDQLFSMPS